MHEYYWYKHYSKQNKADIILVYKVNKINAIQMFLYFKNFLRGFYGNLHLEHELEILIFQNGLSNPGLNNLLRNSLHNK